MNSPTQVLARVSLFSELSEAELADLLTRAASRQYPRNAILINEGDDASSLFIILSGKVKIYASDSEGKEIVLKVMADGDYFGELSLLDDRPRSASVMTLEPCQLLSIARQDFVDYLENRAGVALNLLKGLANHLRNQTESTKNLVFLGVYERVIKLLRDLAVERDGKLLVEGLSQQAIADRVHASREMISLIMKDLKQGGYIDADRKRIHIKNTLPAKW